MQNERYTEIFVKNIGKLIVTEVCNEENYIIATNLNGGETTIIEKNNNKYFLSKSETIKEEIKNNDVKLILKGLFAKEIKDFLKIQQKGKT